LDGNDGAFFAALWFNQPSSLSISLTFLLIAFQTYVHEDIDQYLSPLSSPAGIMTLALSIDLS
jgi:hypothetical protein